MTHKITDRRHRAEDHKARQIARQAARRGKRAQIAAFGGLA